MLQSSMNVAYNVVGLVLELDRSARTIASQTLPLLITTNQLHAGGDAVASAALRSGLVYSVPHAIHTTYVTVCEWEE